MQGTIKTRAVFFVVFSWVVVAAFATDPEIPAQIKELERKIKKAAGQEKVDLLNDLSTKYQNIDPNKNIAYGKQALVLSQKLAYKEGTIEALESIGIGYQYLGDNGRSLEYHRQSLKLAEEIGDRKRMAVSLNDIGNTYRNLGQYDQALEYHQKSWKLNEAIGDQVGIATSLNNIGNIYYGLGQNDQALEYYQKSLKIRELTGNKRLLSNTLINIGVIYSRVGKYDQALDNYQRSLIIGKELGDKYGIAHNLRNSGQMYFRKESYDRALAYYQESLKLGTEAGTRRGIATTLLYMGECYTKQNKFNEAERCFLQSLGIAKEITLSGLIFDIYGGLSKLFELQGNYGKALEYYKLYHDANQQVFNEKSSKQINELQEKYEAEKKAKAIELLTKNNELLKQQEEVQKIKLQKQTLLRNSFLIGFLLTAIIFGLLFKKYLYLFAFWKKEKFIGRYRLVNVIGSGGMSVVYKAHNIKKKSEQVAVKILKEEFYKDDSIAKRFKQESVIIDRLDHPNIVKVFERGEDRNRLFIAMEYLDGKTLAEKIASESPIDLPACLGIMRQLTGALAQIHAHKIIHRDLKPSNVVLISRDGNPDFVKLLDFGLARARFQSTLTKTGELLGTVGYMSPEQLLDKEVTDASDIYSLGVIFYELACGQRAFAADNEIQIIRRILDEMPAPPISIRQQIPMGLNLLILQMLDKDPGRRPTLADCREQLDIISANFS